MRWLLNVALCSAVLCSLVLASTVHASPRDKTPAPGDRIRPQDSRSTRLLRDGMARSETFRNLVTRLEASNVFVYVQVSPFIKSTLAGQLTWMTQAGPYRYLRATISPDQTIDQAIASLAHELQHALEVADDEGVVSEETLVSLYKRIGQPSTAAVAAGWETIAAQETGYQVRRELVGAAGESIAAQLFEIAHV
ncbi:MAG: hypothetical protein AB7P34_22415 [Vicinamibacterales bacterium]